MIGARPPPSPLPCCSGQSVFVLRGHTRHLLSLDWSPNGHHVASGSEDNSCIIWELRQQRTLYTLPAHSALVSRVRFAPASGEFLATSSYDGSARLWSTRDWAPLATLTGHEGKVTCVDVSPDERTLYTASFDRTFKVWTAAGR